MTVQPVPTTAPPVALVSMPSIERRRPPCARLKRTKQRFLMGDRPGPAARMKALRGVLGREEHQMVAAEMAAYL